MGGFLSEPGTQNDLQHPINEWYHERDPNKLDGLLPGLGLVSHVLRCSFSENLNGSMHVDDALVMNKLLDDDCIMQMIAGIWPRDVGVSKEETGPVLKFLNTIIVVRGGIPHVLPHHPNLSFILGCSPHQKIARLGVFTMHVHTPQHLRQFVVTTLLMHNNIVGGSDIDVFVHIKLVMLEIHKLGWPKQWLARCLVNLPRRHNSPYIRACRRLGCELKRKPMEQLVSTNILKQYSAQHGFEAMLAWSDLLDWIAP